MAFDVKDFRELVAIIDSHPEWQRELRRVMLTDEIVNLPESLHQLERSQRLQIKHMEGFDLRLAALAESQERNTAHLAQLDQHLAELDRHMARLEVRVEELAAAQARTEVTVARLDNAVGVLAGTNLELLFAQRAAAYLLICGFRGVHVLSPNDWIDSVDQAIADGRLAPGDCQSILRADAMLRARDAEGPLHLVVEVSSVVDRHDVERAVTHAGLLGQGLEGLRVRPVVAGHAYTAGAEALLASSPDITAVRMSS